MATPLVRLDGLTTAQALAVISRRLDAMLDLELRLLAAELAGRGLTCDAIETRLEDCRRDFEQWRRQQLSEFRRWLVGCDRKLH